MAYETSWVRRIVVILFNSEQVGEKGFHAFQKDISLKVNVIVQSEFEPSYNGVEV